MWLPGFTVECKPNSAKTSSNMITLKVILPNPLLWTELYPLKGPMWKSSCPMCLYFRIGPLERELRLNEVGRAVLEFNRAGKEEAPGMRTYTRGKAM